MWYVEWIGIKDTLSGQNKPVSVPFLYYDSNVRKTSSVFLELRDTETDDLVSIHGFPWGKFNQDVREYHPYGWNLGVSGPDDAMFVTVDEASLEFLDFVKDIYLTDDSDKKLLEFVKTLKYHFTFWDDGQTLVYCSSLVHQNAFTLLQALCYLDEGWYDDKFVLRWGTKGYVIEFTDAGQVKNYISKLRLKGYNPMASLVEELSMPKELES